MVEKLKMKRIPHPTPYMVFWLINGQQVLVNDQTWVEFNIRGYKDKILCDIIPMDVCDLLLGKPWQYDKKTKHDGQKNTYVIEKYGISFTLAPLQDENIETQVGSSVMVREKRILKTMKEEVGQGYAIIIKPKYVMTTTKVENVPKEVQALFLIRGRSRF